MANFTPRIKNIETFEHMKTGTEKLDVSIEIIDEDADLEEGEEEKVVNTKRLTLPVETSDENVKKAVVAYSNAYEKEVESRAAQREQDKKDEKVDRMRDELVGVKLTESVETEDEAEPTPAE